MHNQFSIKLFWNNNKQLRPPYMQIDITTKQKKKNNSNHSISFGSIAHGNLSSYTKKKMPIYIIEQIGPDI